MAARGALPAPAKHPLVDFDMLHLWYFGDAARRRQPQLLPSERVSSFEEVVGGLSSDEATFEARRCLSCGNCCECDGCLGACPEDAVIKLGPGLVTASTTTVAPAAGRASNNARCIRSRCPPSRPHERHRGRQRGGGVGRLPVNRDLLHLPHHALVAYGRAGRRVVEPSAPEHMGDCPVGRGDAERGRRRRRSSRRPAGRGAGHDVHGLSRPFADGPEHVQDRRRAHRRGGPRRRPLLGRPGVVDLRRPLAT